jgi:hypothetical protein
MTNERKLSAMKPLQEILANRTRKTKDFFYYIIKRLARKDKNVTKIFCIGRNKTGTTSLASFFRVNGYKVGNQERAEFLMEDWARRDFVRIIKYCKSAEVFQDIPFSLPHTYETLDKAFPNSKFILTIRTSPEEWYSSVVSFHAKITSSPSIPPTVEYLERFAYRGKYKGWLLRVQQVVYGYPKTPLYDKESYMAQYVEHNSKVQEYFKDRANDLLILNLKDEDAFEKLCNFIGLDSVAANPIPHLNRTAKR